MRISEIGAKIFFAVIFYRAVSAVDGQRVFYPVFYDRIIGLVRNYLITDLLDVGILSRFDSKAAAV